MQVNKKQALQKKYILGIPSQLPNLQNVYNQREITLFGFLIK